MPTYEYVCKGCGERLEVFQSFHAKPLTRHTGCGGDLQKVFHARGVVFKGSGFYVTDSRGGSNGSTNGSNGSSSNGSSKADKKESEKKESASSPSGTVSEAAAD